MTDKTTIIILAAMTLITLAWEAVLIVQRWRARPLGTISMVMKDLGWRFVSIPFAWGALGGHFWMDGPSFWEPQSHALLGFLIGAAVIADLANARARWPRWLTHPMLWLVLGIAAGALLWPQGAP